MSEQDPKERFKTFAKDVPELPTSLMAVSCDHLHPDPVLCWRCAFETIHEDTLTADINKLRGAIALLTVIVGERNSTINSLQNALQSSAASMVTAIDRIQELQKVFEAAKVVLNSKNDPDYERLYKTLIETVKEHQRRIESRS